ncbi:MAG: PorP/SprF family type IX secretion system membrane protein [Flavobacteriaceae bacterium]
MRLLYSLLLFILSTEILLAQEDLPLYQDYLSENYYVLHPSMAGYNLTGLRIGTSLRKQWFNQKNAPATQLVSVEYNPSPKNGLGLLYFNDSNGYNALQAVYLSYSYRIYFNNDFWNTRRSYPTKNDNINELLFGISVGQISRNWDRSHIDPANYDPLTGIDVPNFNDYLTFDVGIGYLSTKFSIQATVKNLAFSPLKTNPYLDLNSLYKVRFQRYILGMQYEFYTLSGWNFEPSILYQYAEQNRQNLLDLNFKIFRILKNGRLWAGISYRRNDISIPYQVNGESFSQELNVLSPLLGLNLRKMSFAYFVTTTTGAATLLPRGIHTLHLIFQLF